MNVEIRIKLTRDEVNEKIPYPVICETRYGSTWDTRKVRNRWREEFDEETRAEAEALFRLAHKWYLTTGVPDEVEMSGRTFALWLRLGEFCGGI